MLRLLVRAVSSASRSRYGRALVAGTGAALCAAAFAAAPSAGAATALNGRTAAAVTLPPPTSTLQEITGFEPNPTSLRVLGARLASTDQPQPTWTHTIYRDWTGRVAVDAYSVAGEDHNLGFHFPDWAQLAVQFFGLTGS